MTSDRSRINQACLPCFKLWYLATMTENDTPSQSTLEALAVALGMYFYDLVADRQVEVETDRDCEG
jgi:hypothetical protein